MTEPHEPIPPQPPTEPPRPFADAPRPAPKGCSRPLLIGCGVLLVLLGIAAIVLIAKAKDLLAWTLNEFEDQIVTALPEEVTAGERARLERAFDAARTEIRDGELEPPALKALQRQLTKAAEKARAKSLTRDDVLDLLSALERVGGLLPADGEPQPPPDESAAADDP